MSAKNIEKYTAAHPAWSENAHCLCGDRVRSFVVKKLGMNTGDWCFGCPNYVSALATGCGYFGAYSIIL